MMTNSALPKDVRRTHIYSVGLPKSGTKSIAQIFSNYRSFHEPEGRDFIAKLNLFLNDRLTREQLYQILCERDRKMRPELESSHFYVYVVDVLVEMHPRAKFVLTVREPISWLRSFINATYGFNNGASNSVWNAYRDLRMRTKKLHPPEEVILAEAGLYSLEGYFSYWRTHIDRVIESVPTERLLVLPTSRISNQLSELAAFARVPSSTLCHDLSHSHKGSRQLGYIDALDPAYLASRCLEICGEPLERLFPKDLARLARVADKAGIAGSQ